MLDDNYEERPTALQIIKHVESCFFLSKIYREQKHKFDEFCFVQKTYKKSKSEADRVYQQEMDRLNALDSRIKELKESIFFSNQ